MRFSLLTLVLAVFSFVKVSGQEITYNVAMPEPHTHYFEVEMVINEPRVSPVEVSMPVWAPGSYLVREFAKSVEEVTAENEHGNALKVTKTDKNSWRIASEKYRKITIRYRVYANELSVRTSFLNADHGYINGTSLFMFLNKELDKPCTVNIEPYKDWKKITTSLEPGKAANTFTAPNYDVLVDCPIEIGNHHTFEFTAAGVPHEVAMFGEGNYDEAALKRDMKAVVEACTDVFGQNPNKRYVFIIHNLTRGSGGLEHANSTSLQVDRWGYAPENKYHGFLSLVAHEYFHLWNVKRIRPFELGPFDYENENYTDLLWVMEGFTSYYDEYLLLRAGIYNEEKLLKRLAGSMGSIENQPGAQVQPVAHASFDAWIKAYRPTENSYNTTISYYTKGAMCAFALDMEIRQSTKGKKSLDDLLQYLYAEFYEKQDRGFKEWEFQKAAELIAGKNLQAFFDAYIYGTEPIPFDDYLANMGIDRINTNVGSSKVVLGASLSEKPDGRLVISRVTRGTAAYTGGLNAEDELLGINGFRVRKNAEVTRLLDMAQPGDQIEVLVSRDSKLLAFTLTLAANTNVRYQLAPKEQMTAGQQKLFNGWAGK